MKIMSLEQLRELSAKVQYALPLGMDADEVQRWIDSSKRRIVLVTDDEAVTESAVPPYPPDGVEFDLAIPDSFTGIEMIRRFGYDPIGWKFNGTEIVEPRTKRCKLVSVGYQPNWTALQKALALHGAIPDGQWMSAFKEAFPQTDDKGPVGVANASWVDPSGSANFPYVDTDGDADFHWSDDVFFARWRWLVEAQAKA